tara:strand:- start:1459 stop:2124 length:666 start_codon:yes stop_codon:yes gene_type:complete
MYLFIINNKSMQFKLSKNNFNGFATWGVALENQVCPSPDMLDRFDQSGYDLCKLEQEYAKANLGSHDLMRYKACIKQDWFTSEQSHKGVHINHSDLYERKSYHGYALEQLCNWVPGNNLLWKMIKLKPKWGIDMSIDYVDNNGHVMELFHYEWDDTELDTVLEKKEIIESVVLNNDWEDIAKTKLQRKDEWQHLDFTGQSEWTTNFLGLPKERFKLVPWKI